MLDTVALKIPVNHFQIKSPDAFNPSASTVLAYNTQLKGGGVKAVYNPTKSQQEKHGYMPRLTLTKRASRGFIDIFLKIEFSAPKLLFQNNFDELCDADFDRLILTLQRQLRHMDIVIATDTLKNAEILIIHYSKNIPLVDYTSCSMVISEIAKCSYTRRLDSVKTNYWNDGSAIRHHASSYEVIAYDKLKDLAKSKISEKRALSRENHTQQHLANRKQYKQPFDVLRLELRLGNRRTIKSQLAKCDFVVPLIFKNLYSEIISKAILLHFWHGITGDMPLLALSEFSPEETYTHIKQECPDIKPSTLLKIMGALSLISSVGTNGLRALLLDKSSPHTWYSINKLLKDIPIASRLKYHAIRVATQTLHEFVPLRLNDYLLQPQKERAI